MKFDVYRSQPIGNTVNFYPLDTATISSPKVTLTLSFITYLTWQTLLYRQFHLQLVKPENFFQMLTSSFHNAIIWLSIILIPITVHLLLILVLPIKLYSTPTK